MICVKCDKPLLECECADAAKRIRSVLKFKNIIYVPPELRARYEQRVRDLEVRRAWESPNSEKEIQKG